MYIFLRSTLKPLIQALYRQQMVGVEQVPAQQGAILASNHLTFVDSIFLPLALDRQIYFLAKSDYFTSPGLKGRLMKWFFTSVGQLPMDRSGGARSAQSLDLALNSLKEGKLIGIYPEGTRSPDGQLYRAKLGVARLALSAQVPIIPVAQVGNEKIQRPGSNRIHLWSQGRPIRVTTIFGQPIDPAPYLDWKDQRAAQRELADRVLAEIGRLLGQQVQPVYAADVKGLMASKGLSAAEARAQLLAKPSGA